MRDESRYYVTRDQLKKCLPYATEERIEAFLPYLNYGMDKYQINNYNRISCFLPQIAHESGCLKYVLEIADGKAYEGRIDLGNADIGDGPKYKGRGLIQITGRNNYITLAEEFAVDFVNHPELLEQPMHAANSACWFWKWRSLNEIADKPDDWVKEWKGRKYNRFEWITVKINGGLNGLADRLKYFEIAKSVLPKDVGYKPVTDGIKKYL